MKRSYPPDPDAEHPMLDARLHLLDRPVIDVDGEPVTAVDDVELSDPPDPQQLFPSDPAPAVTGLLSGVTLGTRIFGGRAPRSRLHSIQWGAVSDVGVTIDLRVAAGELEIGWTERWVRDRIIAKIPGGRHDPE